MNGQSCVTRPQTYMKSLRREWTLRLLTVRFLKGDVNVTHRSDLQTRGHAFNRYKNTHQVTRAEVKTVQRLLICWVLWAQGQCSARCSMTRTEAPGASAGRRPGWGRQQTVPSPYLSHPPLCLALLQGRGCTDSIPALSLLIWGGDNPWGAQQNSGWWGLSWRIKFWNVTVSKISSNYSVMERNEALPLVATWMDTEGYYSW